MRIGPIAVEGSTFYVGSLKDGDIYRGDLETGKGEVFIDVTGRAALGMKVDTERHRLFVAGGPSGRAYVYGTKKGRTLATFRFTKPGQTLVNDVVVTKRAAYFTDSFAPRIYKVPIAPDGSFGRSRTVEVSGPAAAPTDGFGPQPVDVIYRRIDDAALELLAGQYGVEGSRNDLLAGLPGSTSRSPAKALSPRCSPTTTREAAISGSSWRCRRARRCWSYRIPSNASWPCTRCWPDCT